MFVTSLYTVGTIEERIETLLKRKSDIFNDVINDLSDGKLTKVITEEELFSLFDLKKDKPKAGSAELTHKSLSQLTPVNVNPK